MPGGVLPYQTQYINQHLLSFLNTFDYRIGTLECPIGTDDMPFDEVKMQGRCNIIYAREDDFFRLKEMAFDMVSLANNHVMDLGEAGLRNTIKLLDDNGIKYCGAGLNIQEASRPALIEKDGLTVAVLAYCMYGNKYLGHVRLAKENEAGVNPLDVDKVVMDVREAKKRYDKVIVMPHWGREYKYEPMSVCVDMARQMVKAGADAVLGSHTHQIQPLVRVKGKPVCFSMGNFLFPDFYMCPPRPIWYPHTVDEVKGIKNVEGYPYPIEEPIKQVWNPVSRYGCTVGLTIQKGGVLDVDTRYVHSSADNVESIAELGSEMQKQLTNASLMITNLPFRVGVKVKRKVSKLVRGIVK